MYKYIKIEDILYAKNIKFKYFEEEIGFFKIDQLLELNGFYTPKHYIDFLYLYEKYKDKFDFKKTDYYNEGPWSKFPQKRDFMSNRFIKLYNSIKHDGWIYSSCIVILKHKDGSYRRIDGSHRTACLHVLNNIYGRVKIISIIQ